MFRPNTTGILTSKTGYNKFGEPTWSPSVSVPCAIVKFKVVLQATPIRTDSSASHAGSEEKVIEGKVLFPATTVVSIGDKFEIDGEPTRIVMKHIRRSVMGKIDHIECDLGSWLDGL